MADPDMNLLPALDVLLREGSVAAAARVLGLSDSAMSRTLQRLRDATGDALLVRAGRRMVPTPHALALRDRVHAAAEQARAVLRPASGSLDLRSLDHVFTIRANDGFVETFTSRLVAVLSEAAPGVRLRFAPKPDKGVQALRDGTIDLEVGVLGQAGPELKVQALFQDRFVGVVREGHGLATGTVTPGRYAACGHVVASRRGRAHGPVDHALAALGLERRVVVTVPSFPAVMAVAASSDLAGLVTESFLRARRGGMPVHGFPLPVATAPITVSQMWHPRLDAEPAHRWLRETVLSICRSR